MTSLMPGNDLSFTPARSAGEQRERPMRGVKNVRYLTEGEKRIALPVFKLTIPYEKILISDGLGAGSHEFTMPTRIPMTVLFNVSSDDGKYVIHAGDGYFGMDKLQRDKNV